MRLIRSSDWQPQTKKPFSHLVCVSHTCMQIAGTVVCAAFTPFFSGTCLSLYCLTLWLISRAAEASWKGRFLCRESGASRMPLFRKIGHDGFRKPMWTSSLLKRRPHHMLHFSCVHHSFFCYHFLGNLNQGEYTFLSAPHHCELVSLVGNVALILLSKLIKFNILIFFFYLWCRGLEH